MSGLLEVAEDEVPPPPAPGVAGYAEELNDIPRGFEVISGLGFGSDPLEGEAGEAAGDASVVYGANVDAVRFDDAGRRSGDDVIIRD